MALLEVNGIGKSFGTTKVLRDISFELAEGEALAIIGSSGSGKTTLLRCLNFLETADAGSITVAGETLWSAADTRTQSEEAIRKKRLHFGLVFQNFNLFPQYTALQNVMLAGQLLAKERPDYKQNKKQILADIETQARQLLAQMGLSDREGHYPHQLSGGQQQRVAIARALALHPDILCFDEPTSALDPELTGEVLRVLRELAEHKTTMIIVTHEMKFARDVADRILFMDGGVVVEQGEVREIFANPKTAAARRLVAPNGGSAARDLSSFAPDDHVVRVTFNGSSAAKPLVASIAAEKGILVSVLSADTRDLSGQCYGSMLLKLPRDTEQAKQAAAYMRSQNGVTVEEVTGE